MQDTLKSIPARLKAAWRFLAAKVLPAAHALLRARGGFRSAARRLITPGIAGLALYAALVAAVAASCVAALGILGMLAHAGLFPLLVLFLPGAAVTVLAAEVAQIAYRAGAAK